MVQEQGQKSRRVQAVNGIESHDLEESAERLSVDSEEVRTEAWKTPARYLENERRKLLQVAVGGQPGGGTDGRTIETPGFPGQAASPLPVCQWPGTPPIGGFVLEEWLA